MINREYFVIRHLPSGQFFGKTNTPSMLPPILFAQSKNAYEHVYKKYKRFDHEVWKIIPVMVTEKS